MSSAEKTLVTRRMKHTTDSCHACESVHEGIHSRDGSSAKRRKHPECEWKPDGTSNVELVNLHERPVHVDRLQREDRKIQEHSGPTFAPNNSWNIKDVKAYFQFTTSTYDPENPTENVMFSFLRLCQWVLQKPASSELRQL